MQAAAPFARYADDRERDAILRARTHFGDPMAGVGEGRGGSAEPQVADIAQRYGADKLGKSGETCGSSLLCVVLSVASVTNVRGTAYFL
jgi:hypothetical protein